MPQSPATSPPPRFSFAPLRSFPAPALLLDSLGLNPTRATLLDVLTALGAHISVLNLEEKNAELVGSVQISAPPEGLGSTAVSGALAAQLIDELPVLAAIAPYTSGGIRIRDAKELRVKESDRIDLIVKNLRAMGAEVVEFEDGLDVPGGQALHGATIDSGGDHRIAMAFSVAALRAEGETLIKALNRPPSASPSSSTSSTWSPNDSHTPSRLKSPRSCNVRQTHL
jgi:3-phosphoshikimate 1-carboxyvinyltransferase